MCQHISSCKIMYWSLLKECIERTLSPDSHWYIDLLFSLIGLFKLRHFGPTLCCQWVSFHCNFYASCALALLSLLEILSVVIVSTWFIGTSNMLESCYWSGWASERLPACMLCKTCFRSQGANWSTLTRPRTMYNPIYSFWYRLRCFYSVVLLL